MTTYHVQQPYVKNVLGWLTIVVTWKLQHQIIIFLEMLKFSKMIFLEEFYFCEGQKKIKNK